MNRATRHTLAVLYVVAPDTVDATTHTHERDSTMTTRKYYSIIVRDAGQWSPQFGDYVKRVVRAECRDSYSEYTSDNIRIIETDDAGGQSAIDTVVSALNALNDCEVWNVEHTDTFGGQANYSWVKRETVTCPRGSSNQLVLRRAKSAVGMSGWRGRTADCGDVLEFRPQGHHSVLFVTPAA